MDTWLVWLIPITAILLVIALVLGLILDKVSQLLRLLSREDKKP